MKTLKKEIKEDTIRNDLPCSWTGCINIGKTVILPTESRHSNLKYHIEKPQTQAILKQY